MIRQNLGFVCTTLYWMKRRFYFSLLLLWWKGLVLFKVPHWFQEDIYGSNLPFSLLSLMFASRTIYLCIYMFVFVPTFYTCHLFQHDSTLKKIWFSPKDFLEIYIYSYHVFICVWYGTKFWYDGCIKIKPWNWHVFYWKYISRIINKKFKILVLARTIWYADRSIDYIKIPLVSSCYILFWQ